MTLSRPGRLVVLGYHAIADHREDEVLAKWSVTPELFARQLDAIAAAGWSFVDLDAVLAALRGDSGLPRRAVLLSFDDAYADFLGAACPVLAKHGAPAVVFVVAGKVGETNSWDHEAGTKVVELLDAEGLHAAAEQGVEIGSHTTNHRPLSRVPAAELDAEIADSADRLEGLGFPRPRAFAYPYGNCSPELARAVEAAGYEVAFTTEPGVVSEANGLDRFLAPRLIVVGTDSPRDLKLKLATSGWPARLQHRALRLLKVNP